MRRYLLLATVALLSSCTSNPRVVPVASTPPSTAPAAPAFAGYGNLVVPPRLADGSYVTPNRSVSAAGAVWHLRAGLNVAALSCRGPEEAALIAGYNALLKQHRTEFDGAYRKLNGEYGNTTAFEAAMTKLYNYYALSPAQPGLCAAAQKVLADAAQVQPGGMGGFAPAALTRIDQPYRDVFAKQETYLASRSAPATTLVATATKPAAPKAVAVATPVATAPTALVAKAERVETPKDDAKPVAIAASTAAAPRIAVDPAVFLMP